MKRKPNGTQADFDQAARLYMSGKSWYEIAEMMERAYQTVRYWAEKSPVFQPDTIQSAPLRKARPSPPVIARHVVSDRIQFHMVASADYLGQILYREGEPL